jgi:hypothetical protein
MEILDYYAYKADIKPVSSAAPERHIFVPKVFSFIEAPDEAVLVLNDLVRFSLQSRTKVIVIHQEECALIDHCAESAATALAFQARGWPMVRFRGTFPVSEEQRDIVRATGLASRLDLKLSEPEGFLKFPLQHERRVRGTAERSSIKEVLASEVAKHVNTCLKQYHWELTDAAKMYLISLVGEVLENAEEHSQRDDWWIAGYLRQESKVSYGDCHITIFNFGRTLAESLQDLPNDAMLRRDIDSLVRQHKKRFFSGWTEDDLWTLYALQGGVSRFNQGRDDLGGDRGTGTVQMIEFFQNLGSSAVAGQPPKMCIVSGRTHILFDGTYKMKRQKTVNGELGEIIAFNRQNDLRKPPDPKYVRHLRSPFPGTLISLRFYIDPQNLERLAGAP